MNAPARPVVTGKHVLIAMLAFFATVIAVNGVFITLALQSFPGEDVKRSYLQGLAYNQTLVERRAERALGWRAEVAFAMTAQGPALEAYVRDSGAQAIDGLRIEGVLRRPAESAHDIALSFSPRGQGRYVASISNLPPGVWDLRATARRGEQRFSFTWRQTWTPPS